MNSHEIHVEKTKNLFDLKERETDKLGPAGYTKIAVEKNFGKSAGDIYREEDSENTNKQNDSTHDHRLVDDPLIEKPVLCSDKVQGETDSTIFILLNWDHSCDNFLTSTSWGGRHYGTNLQLCRGILITGVAEDYFVLCKGLHIYVTLPVRLSVSQCVLMCYHIG